MPRLVNPPQIIKGSTVEIVIEQGVQLAIVPREKVAMPKTPLT